jgi:hypothetical protein
MTHDNNKPDGMLAYQLAIRSPDKNDPNWPMPSFDARDWADAFCKQHPAVDHGTALAWFAGALMRGFDEAAVRKDIEP